MTQKKKSSIDFDCLAVTEQISFLPMLEPRDTSHF